jgi:hypothetical protein
MVAVIVDGLFKRSGSAVCRIQVPSLDENTLDFYAQANQGTPLM